MPNLQAILWETERIGLARVRNELKLELKLELGPKWLRNEMTLRGIHSGDRFYRML